MSFSLFWILVGCLDWFRLYLVVVQWLRLCYAVLSHLNYLALKLFQVVLGCANRFH